MIILLSINTKSLKNNENQGNIPVPDPSKKSKNKNYFIGIENKIMSYE